MSHPDPYKDSAERFARDIKDHRMTILHDDGLYRHLRFCPPSRAFYWFDLVTWPGKLAFVWSDTSHIFSRVDDMFTFFRTPGGFSINPGYWAEKLVTERDVAQEFSETRFRRLVDERVDEWIDNYDGDDPKFAETLRHEVREFGLYDVFDEAEARHAAGRFEFVPADGQKRVDEAELAWSKSLGTAESDAAWKAYQRTENKETYRFDYSGEWDLREWKWSFLWACHAIVWGIGQYDQAKKAAEGGEPKATSEKASDLGGDAA